MQVLFLELRLEFLDGSQGVEVDCPSILLEWPLAPRLVVGF